MDGKRVGPVSQDSLRGLIETKELSSKDLVWTHGQKDWKSIKEFPELMAPLMIIPPEVPPPLMVEEEEEVFSWSWETVSLDQKIFLIKIGIDRGEAKDQVFGPYSLKQIKKFWSEKRVNAKTLVFCEAMSAWEFIGEVEFLQNFLEISLSNQLEILENEKRSSQRLSFKARIFLHNQENFLEGICSDLSEGGVLVHFLPSMDSSSSLESEKKDQNTSLFLQGANVQFHIHFPETAGGEIVGKAEVVRILSKQSGIGLKFFPLSEISQRNLKEYMALSLYKEKVS